MITYLLIGAAAVIGIALYLRPSKLSEGTYSNVSIDDLNHLLNDKNTILVDVRTPREISQGVIGQPLKIELGAGMNHKFSELDKSKKYILYCKSGRRSVLASKMMVSQGFKDVNNLLGGYLAWKASH